ncbi:MAG: esterase family protein [bacterium]|nr:esterase family protein [bacterium]
MKFLKYLHKFLFFLNDITGKRFLKTQEPIESKRYQTGEKQSKTLMLLLPGRNSKHIDFHEFGFIDAIKNAGAPVDAVVVNAHLGYYYRRNLLPRLLNDIIKPAKENGYESIWITGISMGGIGTALYAQLNYETIDGIFLIAPFLGEVKVIEEIRNAGGVSAWEPKEPFSEKDFQRPLWKWFKAALADQERYPKIYAGYGTEDKHVANTGSVALLENELPRGRVFTAPGGHRWAPWLEVFNKFLQTEKFI